MSGSDRSAEQLRRDMVIPGIEGLKLHHLYQTMHWLGEAKDEMEETMFAGRRDLFSELSMAFFDTILLYFEGRVRRAWGNMDKVRTTVLISGKWCWERWRL